MTTRTRLHSGNSALFVPKPVPKRAVLRWEPAKYKLSWGEQDFPGPHMRVDEGESEYGVDLQVFYATHSAVPGKADHYTKTAPVRALQVKDVTEIDTLVRGRLEGKAAIQAGGWLLQNEGGELYYNSAEEFAKRYERAPSTALQRPRSPTLEQHLKPGGLKRILALDGGGIRGRLTLGILKRLEDVVGGPLCDHFDLIGGTSTGSIIAAGLAVGWSVDKLIGIYDELGASIFEKSLWRDGLWRAKFPAKPLAQALEAEFKDIRLGDPEVKTGLCIVCKRLDTNSVWPLHNHPSGPYFGDPPAGRDYVPNKNYLIRQLVRASSAAPHYFDPERIAVSAPKDGPVVEGAFVDGGVSPHNNPAAQLLLLATLKGYGFGWELGADKLQVVSVGTGTWSVRHDANTLVTAPAAENARLAMLSLMDDCSWFHEVVLQWLSDSPTARHLDGEIQALAGDILGHGDPWLQYVRYDASIELDWLAKYLPEEKVDPKRLKSLRAMDNPGSLALLGKIGEAAAKLVKKEHLLALEA
jgi:hypothetical protein